MTRPMRMEGKRRSSLPALPCLRHMPWGWGSGSTLSFLCTLSKGRRPPPPPSPRKEALPSERWPMLSTSNMQAVLLPPEGKEAAKVMGYRCIVCEEPEGKHDDRACSFKMELAYRKADPMQLFMDGDTDMAIKLGKVLKKYRREVERLYTLSLHKIAASANADASCYAGGSSPGCARRSRNSAGDGRGERKGKDEDSHTHTHT
eukprot:Sspe_Gene.29580::Locus_14127_Transcript_1_1_Confidence_1.000_Length_716::g.29580::m.29580